MVIYKKIFLQLSLVGIPDNKKSSLWRKSQLWFTRNCTPYMLWLNFRRAIIYDLSTNNINFLLAQMRFFFFCKRWIYKSTYMYNVHWRLMRNKQKKFQPYFTSSFDHDRLCVISITTESSNNSYMSFGLINDFIWWKRWREWLSVHLWKAYKKIILW